VAIVSDACSINIINDASRSANDTSRIIIDNSSVALRIVASFTDDSRGVSYNGNMFIVQATGRYKSSYNNLTIILMILLIGGASHQGAVL
jgi:hypothetical protein